MKNLIFVGLLTVILVPKLWARDAVNDSWSTSFCQQLQSKPFIDNCSTLKNINETLKSMNFKSSKILSSPSEGGALGVYYHRKNSNIAKITVSYLGAIEKSDYGFYYEQGKLIAVTQLQHKFDLPRTQTKSKIKETARTLYLIAGKQWTKKTNKYSKPKVAPSSDRKRLEAIQTSLKRTILRLDGPKIRSIQ